MNGHKARLLIIDDDSEVRNVLHDFLSRSYYCVTVDSAEKALVLLANQPFDLIMSDITMAQMSGLEMVPHIARIKPDSIIIMISGRTTIESAIEAMRAGAFDYITKPFELGDVDAAVRRALGHLKQIKTDSKFAKRAQTATAIDLRRALETEEFVVYYQPKVAIDSGKVIGVEALVRWDHPRLGMLPPSDFIPAAEETGLIVELGSLVLRSACLQARRWREAGFTAFEVAVNVSPKQFQNGNLLQTVAQTLKATGLAPNNLQLELTETCLMEHDEPCLSELNELRDLGVKIAIDDFGTGYSSLAYLKRLPIDIVKLDQTFVAGAPTCPDDAALVTAMITLAHNLRLEVIAEGVETEDQLSFLRVQRCDEAQGNFFGAPVPAELIEPFAEAKVLMRIPL